MVNPGPLGNTAASVVAGAADKQAIPHCGTASEHADRIHAMAHRLLPGGRRAYGLGRAAGASREE
jgi:hypothetical protein